MQLSLHYNYIIGHRVAILASSIYCHKCYTITIKDFRKKLVVGWESVKEYTFKVFNSKNTALKIHDTARTFS